jgi:hypothetical protein
MKMDGLLVGEKNRRSEILVGHLYSGKCGSNFEYFR